MKLKMIFEKCKKKLKDIFFKEISDEESMSTDFCKNEFYEEVFAEYEQQTGEKIDDGFKWCVVTYVWNYVPMHLKIMVSHKKRELLRGENFGENPQGINFRKLSPQTSALLISKANSYIDNYRSMAFRRTSGNDETMAEGHALVQVLMESGMFIEGTKVLVVLDAIYSSENRLLQSAGMINHAPAKVKLFEFMLMVENYNRNISRGASPKEKVLMELYEQNLREQQELEKVLCRLDRQIKEYDELIEKTQEELDGHKRLLARLENEECALKITKKQ